MGRGSSGGNKGGKAGGMESRLREQAGRGRDPRVGPTQPGPGPSGDDAFASLVGQEPGHRAGMPEWAQGPHDALQQQAQPVPPVRGWRNRRADRQQRGLSPREYRQLNRGRGGPRRFANGGVVSEGGGIADAPRYSSMPPGAGMYQFNTAPTGVGGPPSTSPPGVNPFAGPAPYVPRDRSVSPFVSPAGRVDSYVPPPPPVSVAPPSRPPIGQSMGPAGPPPPQDTRRIISHGGQGGGPVVYYEPPPPDPIRMRRGAYPSMGSWMGRPRPFAQGGIVDALEMQAPMGPGAPMDPGFVMEEEFAGPGGEGFVEEAVAPGGKEEMMMVFTEAREAVEGNHPDPEAAISRFVEMFGEEALAELISIIQEGGVGEPGLEGGMDLQDGMSDSIPASIDGVQPAQISSGEFVVPSDAVSHLGNGDTEAGGRRMEEMVAQIRKARTGNGGAPPMIDPRTLLG